MTTTRADHPGMLRAAVFRAEQVVLADLVGVNQTEL